MTWNKYFSAELNSFFWRNSETNEDVLKNPTNKIDSNFDKQFWSRQISRNFNKPYWHNYRTNESIWEISAEILEQKEEKKATITKPTTVGKTKEEKPRQYRESSSNSRQISNCNGISYTIEGQSHWTDEHYREELRNINQALREH
jgi:hypothetical protein